MSPYRMLETFKRQKINKMAKQESKFMFPVSPKEGDWEQELGMTKREYFAAKAMQGLISNPNQVSELRGNRGAVGGGCTLPMPSYVAIESVKLADELLIALENSSTNKQPVNDSAEWISVEDSLPKDLTSVLVFIAEENHRTTANLEDGKWTINYCGSISENAVTHWQTLPDKP